MINKTALNQSIAPFVESSISGLEYYQLLLLTGFIIGIFSVMVFSRLYEFLDDIIRERLEGIGIPGYVVDIAHIGFYIFIALVLIGKLEI